VEAHDEGPKPIEVIALADGAPHRNRDATERQVYWMQV